MEETGYHKKRDREKEVQDSGQPLAKQLDTLASCYEGCIIGLSDLRMHLGHESALQLSEGLRQRPQACGRMTAG